MRKFRKDNLYTQRFLSRLAFLKYLNYWKIAGLRPAIFRGTPGNCDAYVEVLTKVILILVNFLEYFFFKLLENSRPTACYFQRTSKKLFEYICSLAIPRQRQ